jgi:vacuolar-type H+-ATPase subunit I/STV1
MINDAHGRTRRESLNHFIKQDMTYADSMDIQFVGRTLAEVLQQALDKQIDESEYDLNDVHNWIKTMKDFHGADTVAVAKRMIAQKEVRIVNNKVVASKFFYNAIDEWVKANNYKAIADDKKIEILDKYCELIGE